ncbi:hypothetical protein KM043_013627 [Ampulex compressa]|nr:hypothetical protein KM043_013627 [Ampulex compressa]
MREALGRTYGVQKRSEDATRGVTAMLPRSDRVEEDTENGTGTVGTDLQRSSSWAALALPCYYRYRRAGTAVLLLTSDRRTLEDDHEDALLVQFEFEKSEDKTDEEEEEEEEEGRVKEQGNEEEGKGEEREAVEEEKEEGEEEEAATVEDVNGNRLNRQNVRRRCA